MNQPICFLRTAFIRVLVLTLCLLSPAEGQQTDAFRIVREELRLVEQGLNELKPRREETRKSGVENPTNLAPRPNRRIISQPRRNSAHSNAIRAVGQELRLIENSLLDLHNEETKQPFERKQIPEDPMPRRQMVAHRPLGSYFLFVNPGITFSGEREYADIARLDTEKGYQLAIAFGKQIGSWTLGVEVGHRRFGYKQFALPASMLPPSSSSSEPATGDSRSYSFALYGGRDIAISNSWNLHTGISLGVAKSEEALSVTVAGVHLPLPPEDKSHFQGSVGTAVEYAFSNLCAAHMGYRFTFVDKVGKFASLPIHQAELGLRWNL